MESQGEKREPNNGQLISVTRKDTSRLLEVYVKRSLSLNDETPKHLRAKGKKGKKWVTMPVMHPKLRRHSSDPCGHFSASVTAEDVVADAFAALPEERAGKAELVSRKSRKKPSLWKSFLGLFSRRSRDEKEPEEQEGPAQVPGAAVTCVPLPAARDSPRRRQSKKRSFPKRRRSLRKSLKRDHRGDAEVGAIVSVEPTYSYYEKVSEEMEKIVHEVKEKEKVLTDEDVINRIIALTKQQGDAIEDKLKENPTLSNFFQGLSYASFQRLADAYLETEATPTQSEPLSIPSTAPELVKLAFTLDFTARVASLSRQSIGHITCLGNRYLEDRFEYKQACTDHPWSDSDDVND